jgi:plasmid stabilization system protein ParE
MKYHLIIKEEANQEIIDSYLYYENQSKDLGEKFLENLETYFDRIQKYPKHYPIKRKPYREVFVRNFPFLIIYEIIGNHIVVYAVFHTSRNPNNKP